MRRHGAEHRSLHRDDLTRFRKRDVLESPFLRLMGLSLEVGILADLKDSDEEGVEYHREAFERLNTFLASRGLPRHSEPLDCEVWSADMAGYSTLHDVRRIAAYLDCDRQLPAASTGQSSKDPCLEGYWAAVEGKESGFVGRLFRPRPKYRREFDHLIIHSDAEGYYLPIDFPDVLFPPAHLEIAGGMVGSVPRLLQEIERLARRLEIPVGVETDTDELSDLLRAPLAEGPLWQRYGRESFGCVTLREGCRHAMATGAALVFA